MLVACFCVCRCSLILLVCYRSRPITMFILGLRKMVSLFPFSCAWLTPEGEGTERPFNDQYFVLKVGCCSSLCLSDFRGLSSEVSWLAGASQETDCESQNEIEEKIKWSCGDCIGHGAFGKVYLGLNTETGNLMAVKQVEFSSMAWKLPHHGYLHTDNITKKYHNLQEVCIA